MNDLTEILQTNSINPNSWESVKRYDGNSSGPHEHYNKLLEKFIETPHVHDPTYPGGARYPELWEMPK